MTAARKPRTRKPKKWTPKESSIQAGIIEYLKWSDVLAERTNTGGMTDAAGNFVRFNAKGHADITGIVRRGKHFGRYVAIEVKRPGKSRTLAQRQWTKMMHEAGAITIAPHSIVECKDMLEWELAKEPGFPLTLGLMPFFCLACEATMTRAESRNHSCA